MLKESAILSEVFDVSVLSFCVFLLVYEVQTL